MSRAFRTCFAAFSCALLIGCTELPPNGQLVVSFATDAPLPREEGESLDRPIPLMDRLRVELFSPGQTEPCDGCTRDFDARHEPFERGEMTFGIVADPGTQGIRLRARLFWSVGILESGAPVPGSTIDVVTDLPPIPIDRVDKATLFLPLDAAGQATPEGPVPAALEADPPAEHIPGSHWAVRRTPCNSAPGPGEACAPGGAFWARRPFGTLENPGPPEHQLVALSPFFVRRTELPVGEARKVSLPKSTYIEWSGSNAGVYDADTCTYAETGEHDDLPMNCVSPLGAEKACAALGAELPSSAMLEYLAGGLQNRRFPWGDSLPSCSDAVWGRNWFDGAPCLPFGAVSGPLPPGSSLRDRTELPGGGEVVDLVGNVGEIARDAWISWKEGGCSGAHVGQAVAVDPVCKTGSVRVIHVGSWLVADPGLLAAGSRLDFPEKTIVRDAGFRCVRPAGPAPSP